MASMWRKAMHYLGLGPDEDYDDYDLLGGGDPDHAMRREPVPREAHHVREAPYREPAQREPVRRPMPSREREPDVGSTVRTLSSAARAGAVGPEPVARGTAATAGAAAAAAAVNGHSAERPAPRPRPTVVRPPAVPPSVKPHAVSPVTFTDAQEVADQFKR